MNYDICYCANEECSLKYKCDRYRRSENEKNKEFWFTIYDPKNCPGTADNIFEKKYFEEIEKFKKEYKEELSEYFTDENVKLMNKIAKIFDEENVSDELREKIIDAIYEVKWYEEN